MCALLRENLNHHNSIVLRKFGTFSFEQKLGEVENKHGQQKTTCTLIWNLFLRTETRRSRE